MARSSECTERYAQKVFDSADIVREAILQQLWPSVPTRTYHRSERSFNSGHAVRGPWDRCPWQVGFRM
jgi:hypothetical protein